MSSLLVEENEEVSQLETSKKPNFVQQIGPKSRNYSTLTTSSHLTPQSPPENDRGQRRLRIASVLCLAFVICEFVAGIIAKSTAVQADAAHMLTDLFSFLISLVALRLARRQRTKRYTYGWARAEVIGALFSIITLWIISAVLGYVAIGKIKEPELDLDATIMIYIASAAIVFNIILALVLKGSGHGHSHGGHGHSHGGQAVNVRAALVHIVGDLVQSIGVLIAGLVVRFYPGTKEKAVLADPICTLIFILIVAVTTLRIVKDLVSILMGSVDPKITENLENALLEYATQIFDLRVWCVVPDKYVVSCRIELKPSYNVCGHPIVRTIEEKLQTVEPGLTSITIQTSCSPDLSHDPWNTSLSTTAADIENDIQNCNSLVISNGVENDQIC